MMSRSDKRTKEAVENESTSIRLKLYVESIEKNLSDEDTKQMMNNGDELIGKSNQVDPITNL